MFLSIQAAISHSLGIAPFTMSRVKQNNKYGIGMEYHFEYIFPSKSGFFFGASIGGGFTLGYRSIYNAFALKTNKNNVILGGNILPSMILGYNFNQHCSMRARISPITLFGVKQEGEDIWGAGVRAGLSLHYDTLYLEANYHTPLYWASQNEHRGNVLPFQILIGFTASTKEFVKSIK